MLTSSRKSSSVSSFSIACFRFTQCKEFLSVIFHLNAFLVSVQVLKDSLISFADRGEGEQDWYVRGDFGFMNFTTFCYLIFNFLLCLEDFFLTTTFTHAHTHDPRPTTSTHYPRPTTSTHYPRPTTFSYTPLAESSQNGGKHCTCPGLFLARVSCKLVFSSYITAI